MNVLFIDNFDSFTYNLVDEFGKRGCKVTVYRNNTPMKIIGEVVEKIKPKLVVISPGPSNPANAGICIHLIKKYFGKIPILGVCLGHQCIIEAFGGVVAGAKQIVHGKSCKIKHDGKTIFEGLENPFLAGRYHSLAGRKIPECLEVSAASPDGEVMAVRHKTEKFVEGVQFHPESIMTTLGGKIIENVIKLCKDAK
ncbi:MAG: anthranilate synthase component II [archaeon GW2011_AR21]|uniref:anthranilate synthase n=1 Tax=Candidatus Iainarchaeum sp. TaxID=3101447 RepID=A0A7J4JVI7_9ARCH|nr:MAG: anthranilate synthase component II [archaeon GW2011_AR21]HIH21484.1 aminodeoxychorismate/anthranilate synthase component II [Candidatus Diapherotrites archaeon]HIH33155.1 aminodeoxychorismate/anthranilate synthase component II [Candidatus Diapherotrites archaeon]